MHPRLSALVLVIAIIAPPLTVHASNMRFLEFSPSAFFTEKDWELVKDCGPRSPGQSQRR